MAPNVLLLILDAARRDAFAPYGAPEAATPNIAALARRGHAAPLAYATSSWTLPSHASLFSGLLPGRIGLTQAPGGDPPSARPVLESYAERLLAGVLSSSGYRCEGFSSNLWASATAGFDVGFDSFTYAPSDRVEKTNALLEGGLRARLAWAAHGLRARADDGAAALLTALHKSISTHDGQPAFWFVNLVECHSPYLPPRPWNDLGAADRVRAAIDCQRYLGFEQICLHAAGRGTTPRSSMERMRHLYARSIAYMDDWLGEVLAALDGRGILDNTLVIVTADHGESFGEDGMLAHGFSLGEQLIHVPLVLAGPGARELPGPFSLARLPGLIAEAAGVGSHPYAADDLPDGAAVAQYSPMTGPSDPRIQAFAAKWDLDAEAVRRLTSGSICATDGARKLVRDDDGGEALYDLEADPGERSPLAPSGPAAESLRAALAFAAPDPARPATGAQAQDAAAGADGAAGAQATPEELAALERQMKLLGYM